MRQTLEVLEANGRKHLSEKEKAEREKAQVRNPEPVKRLKPPDWLSEDLRREFKRVADELLKLMPTMVSRLDADSIGTYCVARQEWHDATIELNQALMESDVKAADSWSRVQDRCFKMARACAQDLGLTLSARCNLVVPEAPEKAEDNPILKLLEGAVR